MKTKKIFKFVTSLVVSGFFLISCTERLNIFNDAVLSYFDVNWSSEEPPKEPQPASPCYVSFSSDGGEIQYYSSNFGDFSDLFVLMRKRGGNMLFDFMDWYEVPNENTYVSTKNNPLNRRHIIGNVADWMSPYKVFAVNDVDGDYASDGEGLFTGGRYILGGSMKDTEAPENLKTARTKSISVSVDGVSVREGFGAYGEKVSVEWVNTVQASNTQKSDGTGREVLEEHIAAQFEGKSVLVSNRITALEDVQIKTYYGMQSCFSGDTVLEYVGCKSNPGLHPCDQNLNTDEYTNGCKAFIGSSYLFEVKINDEGLGNFEYNSSKAGNFINRGSKVYPQLVQQQFAPFLAVKKGQFVEFSGKYFVDVM